MSMNQDGSNPSGPFSTPSKSTGTKTPTMTRTIPLCLNCHAAIHSAGRKIKRKMEQALVTA